MSKIIRCLGVVGCRDFFDYEYVKNRLDRFNFLQLVSGGQTGVDTLAARYSKEELKKDPIEFIPEWTKYGKAAGPIRNALIVKECNILVAFWDNKSPGTKNCIKQANDAKKPVYTYWI